MVSERHPPRPDKRWVRQSFDRAAEAYDGVAVLQREVGSRLLERLDCMRLTPTTLLEVGSGTGYCSAALTARYPKARLIALDLAPAMVRRGRERYPVWRRRWRGHAFICGDGEQLPLADASVDLLFSNLTAQWFRAPMAAFAEFRRVVRPGGLVLFSTLGPDTLWELRAAWATVDTQVHVNHFEDMHNLGDALMAAGWHDPVMEMEHLTLTYEQASGLLRDLKGLGAHNVNPGRPAGLTGRGRLQAMLRAYEGFRREGRLPATYEAIYGHAWVPLATPEAPAAPAPFSIDPAAIGGRRGRR